MEVDKKRLSDEQYKAIELLANGENKTDTGRLVGVTRQTIDNWMKNKEFKAAFDEYKTIIKNLADVEMNGHAKSLMDNLIRIALTGKSEKNRLDATIYGLNRIYGTPTNKIEQTTENKDNNTSNKDKADINTLLNEVSDNSNIIKLEQAK
ncbi:phBC6A51 family helix-turn-helix protein [Clostridium beijerinckii]|uniref:phBC6A51 family helix-turn-helix protein n=1 Tax=Clostridium beijerinckii TaxID=1520 RepID=UPI0004795355